MAAFYLHFELLAQLYFKSRYFTRLRCSSLTLVSVGIWSLFHESDRNRNSSVLTKMLPEIQNLRKSLPFVLNTL